MKRDVIPWKTVEELAALLEQESRLLASYSAALRARRDPQLQEGRAAILLCRYLVEGSAKRAIHWANAMGWRKASSRHGEPTLVEYVPQHLYDLIEKPPEDVPFELVALCRVVYKRQQRPQGQ